MDTSNTGVELIAVRRFTAELGHHHSTTWRWIKRGWLPKPINIGGRLYLTRDQLSEFRAKAERGDFAVHLKPRQIDPNI